MNALAHRDYRSTANVQIYIFKNRVEIVSPGGLPAGMTEADLGIKSIPRNPLLFGMLHRMEAVEHIGSGIKRIRGLCLAYGVAEPRIEVSEHWFTVSFPRLEMQAGSDRPGPPTQSPTQSDPVGKVIKLLSASGELSSGELRQALGIKHRPNFRENYLHPALSDALIEMTIPEKPSSRLQRYRLTEKGRTFLENQEKGNAE